MASRPDANSSAGPLLTGVPGALSLDRARIDSDVREMLRQPSTPWITFNRASRASNLAVGDLLPRRVSVVDPGALAAAPQTPEVPAVEPSGMTVSSDVGSEMPSAITTTPVVSDSLDLAAPKKKGGWSALSIAVVAAGLTLSAGLVMATSMYQAPADRAAAARAAQAAHAAAAIPAAEKADKASDDVPPPDLGAGLANASLPKAEKADDKATTKREGKEKFGRLTIRGAAKNKNVYLDGKRLLGQGTRSFTVLCGSHAVSTAGRNDGKDVDIPCNGELVVDK